MSSSPEKRTFKLVESEIGYVGGSYKTNKSGTPLSAASRAASVLFRMARNETGNSKWKKFESSKSLLKFTIRETTRGSEKKEYQYEAKIKDLRGADIKTIKRGDVEYTVDKKIVVRAAHFSPIKGGDNDDGDCECSDGECSSDDSCDK
jgi:hypothetical protein